ncbi:hypothetical protein AVEN_105252-1 [Araneus ventricosus]|uniref:Fibrinogen C-terminal domain-containing protein n=1 Tax=Araneus ventricosus TaxID=182803 RepID=A0A4Y2WIC5_ARAVE|nr:hypothetical protein AVEN_105252-1 [Araneus ventricosus]
MRFVQHFLQLSFNCVSAVRAALWWDSMAYHNGHVFSTKDSEKSWCAMQRIGAWWYDDCTDSNLNGVFRPGLKGREGITWYRWHNTYSLAGSEIKLRKKN